MYKVTYANNLFGNETKSEYVMTLLGIKHVMKSSLRRILAPIAFEAHIEQMCAIIDEANEVSEIPSTYRIDGKGSVQFYIAEAPDCVVPSAWHRYYGDYKETVELSNDMWDADTMYYVVDFWGHLGIDINTDQPMTEADTKAYETLFRCAQKYCELDAMQKIEYATRIINDIDGIETENGMTPAESLMNEMLTINALIDKLLSEV